jgi:hypothetical protein
MAGFGSTKPSAKDALDYAQAIEDEEKRKKRLFSEILAEIYKKNNAEEFNTRSMPESIAAMSKDILDGFEVKGLTTSRSKIIFKEPLATVTSKSAAGAEIKVSRKYVKSDLSKLDTDGKARAAIEMALIARNNPSLMDENTKIPVEGNDEERLALYLAAQKLGFGEQIDTKSLDGLKLTEAQQQKVAQAVEGAWNARKESLKDVKPAAPEADKAESEKPEAAKPDTAKAEEPKGEEKKEKKDFDAAAKPAPKAPDVARIKGDFDQPIGGILNFYHQQYDKKAVEEIKTKLLALYYFEKSTGDDILPKFKGNIDLKSGDINSAEKLEAFLSANSVPAEFIKQAEDEVAAWKPAPADFPKMGEIADGYRLVNNEVKNELLTAQAVIRTMDRVQRMRKGAPEVETDKNKTFFGHLGKFPNDPPALKEAQQLFALATAAEQAQAKNADLGVVFPDTDNMQKSATALLDHVIERLSALDENKAVEALTAVRESYKPLQLDASQRVDNNEALITPPPPPKQQTGAPKPKGFGNGS